MRYQVFMLRVVVDTNVLVAAMLKPEGEPRALLRLCLEDRVQPIVSNPLFAEYEDVFSRKALFERCPLTDAERDALLDAFLACCQWIAISFLWRPNLTDESDNQLIELAVAGNAEWIVTANIRDLRSGELRFDHIRSGTAFDFIQAWRQSWP